MLGTYKGDPNLENYSYRTVDDVNPAVSLKKIRNIPQFP